MRPLPQANRLCKLGSSLCWRCPLSPVLKNVRAAPLIDDPTPQMSIDMAVGKPQCVGLGCKIAECPPTGSDTVVYGKVTAPNGVDPIREAIVYVPASGIPEEFPGDVSCEVCNSPIGGTPVTQAITGIDGTFELHRVPVTDGTPIVIQKGRWRKTTRIKVESASARR